MSDLERAMQTLEGIKLTLQYVFAVLCVIAGLMFFNLIASIVGAARNR